eukprot:TRINITY_DN1437_c0_g1_i8.p1 TRINITY_DN1437_c0_g1~~TRINITY_DN1437_c0_g1_i8.p1  ORF type:complete len:127 (+),score=34.86 TRINITY_DN1437_c0_g1_i8:191-571(+)
MCIRDRYMGHVNMKEYIKSAVIFFNVQEIKIIKIEYKAEKPIDIEWLKNKINEVISTIKELINGEIGSKGFPLPSVKGIDYTDTMQYIKKGYLEICMNPVFHITTCLLYTSPSPRDLSTSRMPSSA